jgi:hypothetical protein
LRISRKTIFLTEFASVLDSLVIYISTVDVKWRTCYHSVQNPVSSRLLFKT